LEEVPKSVLLSNCSKLEDLEEGQHLLITGFRSAKKSAIISAKVEDKEKPEQKLEDCKDKYFVCSYWLKELLQKQERITEHNNIKENAIWINVVAGPTKTTPTKNKCRMFTC
jgi:hypothetical protein